MGLALFYQGKEIVRRKAERGYQEALKEEFNDLFNTLQSEIRSINVSFSVEYRDMENGNDREVMVFVNESKKRQLAGCYLDKSISERPRLGVIYRLGMHSQKARDIAAVLRALADFADKWEKLERSR